MIARVSAEDYYAVIFSSIRNEKDPAYDETAKAMVDLACAQPGFLGMETARDLEGFGITVSYWLDAKSIRSWKEQVDHLEAQKNGRDKWYKEYQVRICRVERSYGLS